MDPLLILQSKGFRATSGNKVTRVLDLGDDGMAVTWKIDPSDRDQQEFVEWALTLLPANTKVTNHVGASVDVSRRAYAFWKKKMEQ